MGGLDYHGPLRNIIPLAPGPWNRQDTMKGKLREEQPVLHRTMASIFLRVPTTGLAAASSVRNPHCEAQGLRPRAA